MNMKKKFVSLLLCAVMLLSLAACGGGQDSGGGNQDGAGGSSSADKYTEENPYKMTFTFVQFYTQDADQLRAVQDAMNEHLRATYHIEVEFNPISMTEFNTTFGTSLTAGDEYDVVPVFYTNAPGWVKAETLVDLTDYLDNTEDGKAITEAIGETDVKVANINNFGYGLPAMKESIELGGLWMRKDICDELGITEKYGLKDNDDTYKGKVIPWSEAGDIFATVKKAYPDMVPMYMGNSDLTARFYYMDTLIDRFGVLNWQEDHDSTTVVNEFETETFKNLCTMLADWYDKGYIYKDAATDTQGSATMIKAGNTFSYPTPIKPGFLAEANTTNGMDGYALYFGDQVEGGMGTTNRAFFGLGIAETTKDPEMSFKFLRAVYTDPVVMNLWQFGIEGQDYKVLDDGTAYFADGVDATNFKYFQNSGWAAGNQFIGYVWNDGSKTPDYWDLLQQHNTWTYYGPAYGFMWDSSDYSTNITALNTALEKYRAALLTGSVGSANVESTIKQLNDELYAAGLQTIMDAKQEQLNAWLEANGPTQTPQANLDLINSVK